MNCKYCGQELPAGTHGKREYCSDAHRQAYFKKQHQQAQEQTVTQLKEELAELRAKVADQVQGQTFTQMLSELTELRAKVADQAQTIEEQAREISRLFDRLDVKKRYLTDTKRRSFKGFLKTQPETPLIAKLLADQFFLPLDTRAHYEYRLRLHHFTDEEMREFTELWELMLLLKP